MSSGEAASASFPVEFTEAFWIEDLDAASEAGGQAATEARATLEGEGAKPEELMRCGAEHGTDLAGCVKLYVPSRRPPGQWGMVFEGRRDDERGVFLSFIAFGVRHPPEDSPRWTVYERAHHRLHASEEAAGEAAS
jgi:hypothetical protein